MTKPSRKFVNARNGNFFFFDNKKKTLTLKTLKAILTERKFSLYYKKKRTKKKKENLVPAHNFKNTGTINSMEIWAFII